MNKVDKKMAALEDSMQVVTFHVGGEEYGIGINAVAEVIRPLPITPLPRMPEFIEGVINLRGTIIPVVDLRRRFGVKNGSMDPRKTRMMIIKGAAVRGLLGLVVDGVREVTTVPSKHVDSLPEAARGPGSEFISGMAKLGDRLVILLDAAAILSKEERVALMEADREATDMDQGRGMRADGK